MHDLPEFIAVFDDTERHTDMWGGGRPYTAERYKILGLRPSRSPNLMVRGMYIPSYDVYRPSITMAESSYGMQLPLIRERPRQLKPHFAAFIQERGPPVFVQYWETQFEVWYNAQRVRVPVVGFVQPQKLIGRYLYEAEGDTEHECRSREMVQQSERFRIIDMLRQRGIPQDIDFRNERWEILPIRPPSYRFAVDSEEEDSEDEELHRAIERSLHPRPPSPEIAGSRRSRTAAAGGGAAAAAPAPAPSAPLQATAKPPPPKPDFAPKFVLELLKKEALAKGETCPISMTSFAECKSTSVTPCFHLFDSESLRTWLGSHTSCPVCKQSVTTTVTV